MVHKNRGGVTFKGGRGRIQKNTAPRSCRSGDGMRGERDNPDRWGPLVAREGGQGLAGPRA